jgi:hypothetical protein
MTVSHKRSYKRRGPLAGYRGIKIILDLGQGSLSGISYSSSIRSSKLQKFSVELEYLKIRFAAAMTLCTHIPTWT